MSDIIIWTPVGCKDKVSAIFGNGVLSQGCRWLRWTRCTQISLLQFLSGFGLCFKGWPLRLGVSRLINCNLDFCFCNDGIFHFIEAWLKLSCSCSFPSGTWDVTVVCVCWYGSAWAKVEEWSIKRCLSIRGSFTAAVLCHQQRALGKGLLWNSAGCTWEIKVLPGCQNHVYHCMAGLLLPSPAPPPPPATPAAASESDSYRYTGGLGSWHIGELVNEFWFIITVYTKRLQRAEIRLPLSLGTRRAHRQDAFYFDLVSIWVNQSRKEGHIVTLIFFRGGVGEMANKTLWPNHEVASAFPSPCAGSVLQGILGSHWSSLF